MRTEVFRSKDYAKTTQAYWYRFHGNPINERLLSRFGVVVLDAKDNPLAIAYIYPASTADIAWIGFTVVDPYASKFMAGKALKLLLPACEDAIAALGYSVIYAGYDAKALQKLCRQRGYYVASQVQEFFLDLGARA